MFKDTVSTKSLYKSMTLQSGILTTVSINVCCLELTNRLEAQQKLHEFFKKHKDEPTKSPKKTGRYFILSFSSWGLSLLETALVCVLVLKQKMKYLVLY